MTGYTAQQSLSRADRALELYEKGIDQHIIAQRLGTSRGHVGQMIQRAKAQRDARKEQAQ